MKFDVRFCLPTLLLVVTQVPPAMASPNYLASTASGVIKGDFNFDGQVNDEDADAFQIALSSTEAYERQFGVSPLFKGDIDGNGIIDIDDIPGYLRLLNPVAPDRPLQLIRASELDEHSVIESQNPSDKPSLGLLRMSTDGRYAVAEGGHTFIAGILDSIKVSDTFSNTDFLISVPPGSGFDGFYHESLAISGNGRYVALTGVHLNRDDSGRVINFSSQVVRYNLATGALDYLPPVDGRNILFSFQPSLSNDGTTLLFRGVTSLGEGNYEIGAYVTRFRIGARGNVTKLVTVTDRNTVSTAATLAPRVSGDGKFALIPYTKAEHIEWNNQGSSPFPEHLGLSLYDLSTNSLVKQLADGASTYNAATGEALAATTVEQEVYDISRNGNIVAFCKVETPAGSARRTVSVNLYNRRLNKLTLVETLNGSYCPEALDLSDDSVFLSYGNKIYQVGIKKFSAVPLPEGVEQLHGYFGIGAISGDGCFLGLSGRGPATNNEYASFIVPNPMKNCHLEFPPGDVNKDGCVNGSDYMLWLGSNGANVTAGEGADVNSDGTVDASDLEVIRDNYGSCTR